MKKLLLLPTLLGFLFLSINAQEKIEKPTGIKVVKSAPPAPVQNKTVEQTDPPVYRLTSVRVTIRTGSDNKEFPSTVSVALILSSNRLSLFEQPGSNMRNEMKINSTTEIGLQKFASCPPERLSLETLQNAGITLHIYYDPNIFTDAWKIEGVSAILEFRDQHGNLHPTLGYKTIVFNNASGFLNAVDRAMDCTTDGTFMPLTSSIK
jgi:hypothetical protein